MGSCSSVPADKDQIRVNKVINKQIKIDKKEEDATVKLLLLGASECGKSTVLKQIKILHNNGFSEEERKAKKAVIYSNSIHCMAAILRAMQLLGIELEDAEKELDTKVIFRVLQVGDQQKPFTSEVSSALQQLWSDAGVQKCYARRNEYRLLENAKYFLDSIERISQADFEPSDQDILQSRVLTINIVQMPFTLDNIKFRVFDVGGQRSQRRKWIHCFDNVNAIVFIASLSEYNQQLVEDKTQNRMHESIELFGSVVNSAWFIKTAIILFLNKKDLFEEKIRTIPLTVAFKDYTGEQNYEQAVEYIETKFFKRNLSPSRTIYSHQTCATDKNQLEIVLNNVIDTVTKKNVLTIGAS